MDMTTILELDSRKIASTCLKHIDHCMARIGFLLERMGPVIEEYGRLQGMHKYKYFIYYDIVDSTATNVAKAGGQAERHQERVGAMKRAVSKTLQELAIIARKQRGEVFCTNGNTDSDNDCKHIFISGRYARKHVEDCISRLLYLTESFPGVYLRIYALPCDFVRSEVYRYQNAEEVCGARFWTTWSRLLKAGKRFEEQVGNSTSFLLVGDDVFYGSLDLSFADWSLPTHASVDIELAEVIRRVSVRYGALKLPSVSTQ
jgi:hypothetical protein